MAERRGQAAGVAAVDMAARDDDVGFVRAQQPQHLRQAGFIMLHVAIDDRDVVGG